MATALERWRVPFVLAAVICGAFIVLLAVSIRSMPAGGTSSDAQVVVGRDASKVGPSAKTGAGGESESPRQAAPLLDAFEDDWVNESDAMQRGSTVEDLTAKGFPLMSNPRKTAYTQTASQSIPEVVADLGNAMTLMYCAETLDIVDSIVEISRYSRLIPSHIKVVRLIEEGRRDPNTISHLLRDAIRTCMADYDEVDRARKVERVKWRRGESRPSTGDRDPYYKEHRRYESPILEFQRIHHVVYSSFYVLATLGELDQPALLADWISQVGPRGYTCKDMDVWLIDVCFRQPHLKGSTYADRHADIAKGIAISGAMVHQSKWNALWDIHDFLLAARNVDLSDIETIEVPKIPGHLPKDLDASTKDHIIANFLKYAEEVAEQQGKEGVARPK